MKKTVNINLSGQVFQIDEDAYVHLEAYITLIRNKYKTAEGGDEIIADIEARLGEMFTEILEDRKVISVVDVDVVMEKMGRPEEFETDEETEEELFSGKERRMNRRLYRNPDDKVAGGVLSGISAYLGFDDPIWLRIAFVVFLFISFGTALIIYIVALIIIPEAKTSSEKLQMRGEQINLENIERTFKESMDNLKDNFHTTGEKGRRYRNGSLSKFVHGLANLLVLVVRAFVKILGFGLATIGILWIIGIIIALVLPTSLTGFGVFGNLPFIFPTGIQAVLCVLGFGLLILVPIVGITLLGFRLMAGRRIVHRSVGISLVGLWVLGIILSAYTGIAMHKMNDYTKNLTEVTPVEAPASDIMYLNVLKDDMYEEKYVEFFDLGQYRVENDTMYVRDRIELDIIQSKDGDYKLETNYYASGSNRDEAFENAGFINYSLRVDSTQMEFPVYMKIPESVGIHHQEMKMTLHLPVGQAVYLSREIRELIYDIKNVTNTYDGKMVGHIWEMRPEGLTCTDCGTDVTRDNDASEASEIEFLYGSFDELELGGHFAVNIVKADEYKLRITGNEDAIGDLNINQNGNKLEVDNGDKFFDGDELQVWVYAPSLKEILIQGAITAKMTGLDLAELKLNVQGANNCDFTLNAGTLQVELDGASKLKLSGKAGKLEVNMTGASNLNAFALEAKDAELDLAGACSADVFAIDNLNAVADGVSHIRYKGSPSVSSEVSGFSSIKPK